MFRLPSPLQKIDHPLLDKHGVNLLIKRDDLIHTEVSGNKWRKLKYNIEEAQKMDFKTILTYGGAYSNHIAATAAACTHFGLKSIGIIRGDELNIESNETLKMAHDHGMELRFVDRQKYKNLKLGELTIETNAFTIPEGGANELGVKGCAEIIGEMDEPFDHIITSIGTGTTMAGILAGLKGERSVIGFSSLKGDFVHDSFAEMLSEFDIHHSNYTLHSDFHFGGYGKTAPELINFINRMKIEINVLFDPIYTGKAFFGVWKLISDGKFDNQTLIFLHTGGLQGIAGHNQKSLQKIHI